MNPTKLIALDPNVFLAIYLDHEASKRLLDTIYEYREYVRLIHDIDGVIWEEYKKLSKYFYTEIEKSVRESVGETRNDNSAFTRLSWLLQDQSLTRKFPVDVQPHMTKLAAMNCDKPVEPHLLILCKEHDAWMLIAGRDYGHEGWRRRGTHDGNIIAQLKTVDYYPHLKIFPAGRAERLLADWVNQKRRFSVYPHTELELEDFMVEWRKSGERDLIEFKQPRNKEPNAIPDLTKSILGEATEAICGMANSYGGKVFIGITPEGEIKGFEPAYNKTECDDDSLRRQLRASLSEIKPNFEPNEIRFDLIDLKSGRKVFVIDVEKPNRNKMKRREYNGRYCYRQGSETLCTKKRR